MIKRAHSVARSVERDAVSLPEVQHCAAIAMIIGSRFLLNADDDAPAVRKQAWHRVRNLRVILRALESEVATIEAELRKGDRHADPVAAATAAETARYAAYGS